MPFDIAEYALLTHLMALETGLDVGEIIFSFGDIHLYNNQFDAIKLQLERDIREMPQLEVKNFKSIFELKADDIQVVNYDPHPFIPIQVAV